MADANNPDKKVVGKAFTVEIAGRFLPIKSVSGGQKKAEKTKVTHGTAGLDEYTLGHNALSPLTIQAYMVPGDKGKILSDCAKEVCIQGTDKRYQITIVELAKDNVTPVKRFEYDGCLFASLDFPRVSSSGAELLVQTAVFHPQICKVKKG